MNAKEIICWCKDIWAKKSSTPAESDEMSSDKPISVSGSTTIIASGPVGATVTNGATGADGHGEVQSG